MTQDTDYFSVTAEDTKEERARINRCSRAEKPASENLLMTLEEERRLCALLEPLMF